MLQFIMSFPFEKSKQYNYNNSKYNAIKYVKGRVNRKIIDYVPLIMCILHCSILYYDSIIAFNFFPICFVLNNQII